VQDDQSPVSVFSFDFASQPSRRSLLPLAKNALRKLKTLRHPDVLKYIDGVESDAAVWIVTERVTPLTKRLGPEGQIKDGGTEEWKVWGLSRITVRAML
jgi:SCY1-like protein 1